MTASAQGESLLAELNRKLADGDGSITSLRESLDHLRARLRELFDAGVSVPELVALHAQGVDQVLIRAWRPFFQPSERAPSLVAVGGYGRGDLHLASDIDLLILLGKDRVSQHKDAIQSFLTLLWDIGLEVGHAVRSAKECQYEARNDITVATNLMEARLLEGSKAHFNKMRTLTGRKKVWPTPKFFRAKLEEQQQRHLKFNDTAYNLEPNIKEGPGALRDIQTIGWVLKRHFDADRLDELVTRGFLTEDECDALQKAQEMLWRIRFALHSLTGRREDRLLFDHQREVAARLGYRDSEHHQAVEVFMKDYFLNAQTISRFSEMLLQLFQEAFLPSRRWSLTRKLNERFQVRNRYLETVNDQVFSRHPAALLEMFLLLEQHPELEGVRATTIRQLMANLHRIDDAYRADPRHRQLFLEIISQPQGITHELRRMHRYGVLAAFLPTFGAIVGQMQYDLFHIYTVDEHTLFVVRNLRRFAVPEHAHEFPLASQLIQRLPKPELLYLAGLFHDIAKGRGGDHSELGAVDANNFCRYLGLTDYDSGLVSWLVRQHLNMSGTAQRQDIADPEVINRFAATVRDVNHLNYLYLLTVADIRATNPKLWNSWKDSLLQELYHAALRVLRRGLDNPLGEGELVDETRREALSLLSEQQQPRVMVDEIWQGMDNEYFLRHTPEEIAWQTRELLSCSPEQRRLVAIKPHSHRGGSAIFVCALDQKQLFLVLTTALDQMGLNVVDARIITTPAGATMDTFIVLEQDGSRLESKARLREIETTLDKCLKVASECRPVVRRGDRQIRHFPIKTQVYFEPDETNRRTVVEVHASDRPGLLSRIAAAIVKHSVSIHNAKIATIGARAEDIFFVTDHQGDPLDSAMQEQLRETIGQALTD